jgi:hypothetical protein
METMTAGSKSASETRAEMDSVLPLAPKRKKPQLTVDTSLFKIGTDPSPRRAIALADRRGSTQADNSARRSSCQLPDRRGSASPSDHFQSSSSLSCADAGSGGMSPISRKLQLLSQNSYGNLLSPLSYARGISSMAGARAPVLQDPAFEPGHVIETGRVPHYLVGRERSLLRQALDDHELEADVRRMEERAYKTKASLVGLHRQRAQRREKKKKLLDLDRHTAPKPHGHAKTRSPMPRASSPSAQRAEHAKPSAVPAADAVQAER